MGAPYRSGLVALAGRPNVGKSTLANALAGSQVAAVSPRPQTTRRRITAVAHGDGWQAVLLDLPGLPAPGRRAHGPDAGHGRQEPRPTATRRSSC